MCHCSIVIYLISMLRPGCSWWPCLSQVFVGPSCFQLGGTGSRVLPPRALGAKFARVSLVLQNFANNVYSTEQVWGSCLCVRARLRRVGPGPTKRNLPRARC